MNTLTGIEAERVSQILRHAVDRLHILSFVPTAWNDDVATSITCDPVLASLEKQWISEDLLNNISLIGATEGGKDIAAIKQAHRATRTTCRNLMAERESLQVLMNRPEIQSEAFLRVLKNLSELKSQITDRMTTTVEDEATNRTTLQELVERERIMEESRDTLQTKLAEVREEKERVTFNLDQNLKKLQIELQDITSQNKLEVDSVQKEMTEALSKAGTDHDLRMKQLQDQVDALDRQLSEIVEKNREDEIRLRKGMNEHLIYILTSHTTLDKSSHTFSHPLFFLIHQPIYRKMSYFPYPSLSLLTPLDKSSNTLSYLLLSSTPLIPPPPRFSFTHKSTHVQKKVVLKVH